jgi:hypothetical protein
MAHRDAAFARKRQEQMNKKRVRSRGGPHPDKFNLYANLRSSIQISND